MKQQPKPQLFGKNRNKLLVYLEMTALKLESLKNPGFSVSFISHRVSANGAASCY